MEQTTEETKSLGPRKELAQRCFNIIDSVKGGSGKTSLSLMLALAAQRYMREREHKNHTNYSLLMDMDMQGSALRYLLFGDNPPDEKKVPDTLNDAILKYYTKKMPEFISKPSFFFSSDIGEVPSSDDEATAGEGGQSEEYQIAVALASTEMSDRDRFRAVSRMNYSSHITYDAFNSGLKTVLKESNLNSYLPDRLQYVFFDMPPNSNGYSDCILELLLSDNVANSTVDSKYPRNYFELMTLDHGHIRATLDWFQHYVQRERYHFPDHFFFVFSNIPSSISQMEWDVANGQFKDKYLREAIFTVKEKLDDLKLSEENRKRIHIVGVSYQDEYLKKCCSSGTLASTPQNGLNRSLLTPIKFLMNMDGTHHEDTKCTDELLELMCTKE